VSCLPDPTKLGDELKCTLIGGLDSIGLKAESDSPLPANLVISLEAGGASILVDECNDASLGNSALLLEQDRSSVAVRFILEDSNIVQDFYFPRDSSEPVADTAAYKIYKRENCSGALELVSDRPNNVVTWLPEFANGKNCEKTSNSGYSSFKLTP